MAMRAPAIPGRQLPEILKAHPLPEVYETFQPSSARDAMPATVASLGHGMPLGPFGAAEGWLESRTLTPVLAQSVSTVVASRMDGEDCVSSEAETGCGSSDPGGVAPGEVSSSGSSSGSAGVGTTPRSGAASEGSALHGTGDCRPCAWYWKPTGCENEAGCRFCHMCPDGEVKNRKKSKLTAMRRARGTTTDDGAAEDSQV